MHASFGFRRTGLNVYENYLSNRYQYANVFKHYSSKEKITNRVPQESYFVLIIYFEY